MCINPSEGGILGTMLDPFASLINHSCEPNAFIFSDGGQLRVRSLRPLSAGDEITICYADVAFGVMIRQESLRSKYFFICRCK